MTTVGSAAGLAVGILAVAAGGVGAGYAGAMLNNSINPMQMNGPTGPTGAALSGPTGPTGSSSLGSTGPTGANGAGATGPTGGNGVGTTGPTGAPSSVTGPTGASGLAITGPTGASGSGATGATGPQPNVPTLGSGNISFGAGELTVTMTATSPSFLAYRTSWMQIGNIYVVGLGGTVSVNGGSLATGTITLTFAMTKLPDGGNISSSLLDPPGGGLGILFPGSQTCTQQSVTFRSGNVVLSWSFANGGFNASDQIPVNATIVYAVP